MAAHELDRLEILQPSFAELPAAIERLLADVAPGERQRQAADLLAACQRGPDRVFEARRSGTWVGAAAVRFCPGATATMSMPQVAIADAAGTALVRAAADYAAAQHVTMVQALVEIGPRHGEWFQAAGFEHTADLVYLCAGEAALPCAAPEGALEFLPFAAEDEVRLERIVEATYEGTLDCPRLNGTRRTADVLAGYRDVGRFDERLWQIARLSGHDAGCLLLNDHASPAAPDAPLELVYMGLTPESRGRGLGRQLVRQALWMTRQRGRTLLAAAVDAANAPALHLYTEAGFTPFDTRAVYLRFASASLTPPSSQRPPQGPAPFAND